MARVLVLLPPSEGKSASTIGPGLDLAQMSLPELTPARTEVLDALTRLAGADPERARKVLGLSPRQRGEVARDAGLRQAPTAAAAAVYSGVLFAALDAPGAPPDVFARLTGWVLVWSGLWGAVRLDDPIPAYRLSGAVTLPGPGRLSTFWRRPLAQALGEVAAGQVILDLRSGTYASTWSGPRDRSVVGRVIHDQDGRRTVASHFNKATKGRLVRALAETGAQPGSIDELVDAIRAAGFRAELAPAAMRAAHGARAILDVVVDTL
jgi:hypothetical protein